MSKNVHFYLCLPIVLLTQTYGFAQSNQSENMPYLSSLENEVVHELNLCRLQPQKYADLMEQLKSYYVGKFIKQQGQPIVITEEGVHALEEAIRYLRTSQSLPPLKPSPGMSLAAKDHVIGQGPTKDVGHRGRDGSYPVDRISRYGKWYHAIGENIAYGRDNARAIVMGLLIDDGVPDRGHRKTIFNAEYRIAGIAFGPHSKYGSMCVMTFAKDFQEYGYKQVR